MQVLQVTNLFVYIQKGQAFIILFAIVEIFCQPFGMSVAVLDSVVSS
jgi:hypothetical protein